MEQKWMSDNVYDEIILYAEDDWMYSGELFRIMWLTGIKDRSLMRDLVITVVLNLMLDDYIEVGDTVPRGFTSWGLSPGDTAERIARLAQGEEGISRMEDDFIFWIRLTEAGRQRAIELEETWV